MKTNVNKFCGSHLIRLAICLFFGFSVMSCSDSRPPDTIESLSVSKDAININTATAQELERLPNIGAKTAMKIVAYREKYGDFRKVEHLMLIDGISDKRFRELRNQLRID